VVRDFATMILGNLRTAGVQQADKADRISFTSLTGWPGSFIAAEGRFMEGDQERRAGIFIGPEFGTVARPDLVAAAREAGDAGFDLLIACAFAYDAHSAEFDRLGRVRVLKARMNPDLHMAKDLKATGTGNLFVVFGEPDIRIDTLPDGMGIDVRGRSHGLKINYRTSHQIRTKADRLLPGMVSDVDGTQESRRGTVSLFDGPTPVIGLFRNEADEAAAVGAWITERLREGCAPDEIGILVRSQGEVARARAAVKAAGAKSTEFDEKVEVVPGAVSISQMHLAKGLEFRAVAVMACDDEVLPLQERVESVTDEADLEEVYETERHLLYVACTRARDNLWVSGVGLGSEFLRDVAG
jgi:hypothetical protein